MARKEHLVSRLRSIEQIEDGMAKTNMASITVWYYEQR